MFFWEALKPMFESAKEPVMLFRAEELVYANAAARALIGTAATAAEIFPGGLPQAGGTVQCALGGKEGSASATPLAFEGEEILALRFRAFDDGETEPVSNLLDSVGGELRESMSVISMAVELLMPQIENSENPKLSTYISMLNHHQRRIQRIAGNIGGFCELASGGMSLDFEKFDLVELCSVMMGQVADLWDNRGRKISFTSEVTAFYTLGDVEKLKRMLLNLISNSMKHTAEDGSISLAFSASGERARLTLTDDGEGMTPEVLSSVFRSFEEPVSTRDVGSGVGLGLAIANGIARLHGGAMMIESRPGVGTRVTVTLKVWPEGELGLREEVLLYGPTSQRILLTELSDALGHTEYSPKFQD